MEVWRCMVRLLFILLFSVSVCYGQANRFAGFGYRSTCDVDALKYIDSSHITNTAQKDAICTYFKMLKDSLLWTKIEASYIFIGGSASSSKYNMKDIRNDTSAFVLDFFGGWTFSSSGALANGINAYAKTYLRPAVRLSIRDYALTIYINGGTLSGGAYPVTMAATSGNDASNLNGISLRSSIKYFIPNGDGNPFLGISNSSLTGIFLANVLGSTATLYRDGLSLGSTTTSGGALSNQPFTIAQYNSDIQSCQNIKIGCIVISKGLTAGEAKTLTNIISIFRNTLGI